MAISEVLTAPADIVSLMENLIDPTDANHADGERALIDRARQLGSILGSRFYRFEDNIRPFCGFTYNPTSPEIVMPLRNITPTPDISYRNSYHDIAAIQFSEEMKLVASRDKWDDAIIGKEGINNKINKYLKDAFGTKNTTRPHKFKIIIFDDLDDLKTQLDRLSKTDLINPVMLDHDTKRMTKDYEAKTPPLCSLRSLSLQIHDTSIVDKNSIQGGSYFFNLMSKEIPAHHSHDSICNIQCCIPVLSEPCTIVGNFVNFVITFLIALNLNEGDTENFGLTTRHRTLKANLNKSGRGFETRGFFCEQTLESEEELASIVPSISSIVSFYTKYQTSINQQNSEFFRWLHEYNLRVFNQSMLQLQTPTTGWDPRKFFYSEYNRIISFFISLEDYSDTWKSHKDQNLDLFRDENGQIKPPAHHNPRMYRDLIKEVKLSGDFDRVKNELSVNPSNFIQFQFYSEIISLFWKIHNKMIAPSGHLEQKAEYSFFFMAGEAKVSLQDLMYLATYNELVELCDTVTLFEKNMLDSGPPSANAWNGFSDQWRLEGRS